MGSTSSSEPSKPTVEGEDTAVPSHQSPSGDDNRMEDSFSSVQTAISPSDISPHENMDDRSLSEHSARSSSDWSDISSLSSTATAYVIEEPKIRRGLPPWKEESVEDEVVGSEIKHELGSWLVSKKIAKGPFSDVYIVTDVANKIDYAMKAERADGSHRAVLKLDVLVLMRMRDRKAEGFPKFVAAGRTEDYKYCIMQYLGPDIGRIRRTLPAKCFSTTTALKACLQTLDRLEALHEAGWLCRDVKGPNFAIGRGPEEGVIYMLDFGFAHQFRKDDGTMIPPRKSAALLGTFQYAPLAAHEHKDQAPKDDLESWFYMAVELIKGPLPWSNFGNHKEMAEYKRAVRGKKRTAFLEGIPEEFDEILTNIDGLQYFERPDYDFIRRQIRNAATRLGLDLNEPFEWEENRHLVRKAYYVGELGESFLADTHMNVFGSVFTDHTQPSAEDSGRDSPIDSQLLAGLQAMLVDDEKSVTASEPGTAPAPSGDELAAGDSCAPGPSDSPQ